MQFHPVGALDDGDAAHVQRSVRHGGEELVVGEFGGLVPLRGQHLGHQETEENDQEKESAAARKAELRLVWILVVVALFSHCTVR